MALLTGRFEWDALSTRMAGVAHHGDAYIVARRGRMVTAAVINAAGHGPAAETVCRAAFLAIQSDLGKASPRDLFVRVHRKVVGSGGVSLAIARIEADKRIDFFGAGDIIGRVVGSTVLALASDPGLLGLGLPRPPSAMRTEWRAGDLLLLAANGVVDRWETSRLHSLRHAPLRAVMRGLAGPEDRWPEDATVLVIREPEERQSPSLRRRSRVPL